MKLNKKIIGLSVAGLATFAVIPTLAVTLTSCSSDSVGDFYNALNDPYKELNMFATTMDAANLKSEQVGSSTNNQPTKLSLDSSYGNNYFAQKAQKINQDMRTFVQKLSSLKAIQDLVEKNATVLFLKNSSLNNTTKQLSDTTKQNASYFQIEQPILYSQVYSTPEVTECPGFGFKFPAPINNSANKLFDDWFEIGAKAQNDTPNSTISAKLTNAWKGTADFVFYLYDSKNFTPEAEKEFVKFVYNNQDPKFYPNQLLKSDAEVKHVIPLDMQWMYNGIWDQIGSFTIDYLLAMIFSNIENNGIKKFYDLGFKNVKPDGTLTSPNQKSDNLVLDAVKEYIIGDNNSVFTPTRATKTLNRARPITPNGDKTNFVTTMFNTTGHALSLGIAPDYTIKNASRVIQHSSISAYLEPYLNTNTKTENTKPNTQIIDNIADGTGFISQLEKIKTYALADNQDSFGDNVAPWPLNLKNTTANQNGVQLFHEDIGTTDQVVTKAKIKPVYTQRNDNKYTQYGPNEGESFDLQLYDTTNTKVVPLSTWLKEN